MGHGDAGARVGRRRDALVAARVRAYADTQPATQSRTHRRASLEHFFSGRITRHPTVATPPPRHTHTHTDAHTHTHTYPHTHTQAPTSTHTRNTRTQARARTCRHTDGHARKRLCVAVLACMFVACCVSLCVCVCECVCRDEGNPIGARRNVQVGEVRARPTSWQVPSRPLRE